MQKHLTFAGLLVQHGARSAEGVAVQRRVAGAQDQGQQHCGPGTQRMTGHHQLVVRATRSILQQTQYKVSHLMLAKIQKHEKAEKE